MHSPFPGMDPWLEGDLWTTVRAALIARIWQYLSPRVQPRYVALMEKRFVMAVPEVEDGVSITAADGVNLRPDVGLVKGTGEPPGSGATAVAPAPLELMTVMAEPVPHHTVEIRDVANRQLVTAIEVLSPTNKRGQGREEYLARRNQLLLSRAHLVEIDLLRAGHRVPMRQPLPPYPYFLFVSRAGRRPLTQVWPAGLRQPLPPAPVPLLAGDPEVSLDLQQVFGEVYDITRYDLLVDYSRPPEPPLESADAAWAEERVREWSGAAGTGGGTRS